jgi:hypothetical protein
MTGDDEAALYALAAEPRSARAGETILIRFRTRNVGTMRSPPGTVVFALGKGLEPSGPLEVAVEPVAPGEDVVATVGARVAPPGAERTEIVVRAALHVPGAVLRTNACTVVVHGRPAFDGPGSGTFVEAVDAHTVRVRAVVTNEGDGPALGVRIVVPVPAGCARDDGRGDEIVEVEQLAVGQSVSAEFAARIAAVVGEVRAERSVVCFGDGRRAALPVRSGVVPKSLVVPPRVVVTAMRRRADVAVELRNDGWADARDVRVRADLPPGLKWIADAFALDGAPVGARPAGAGALARVEREGDGRVVVISAVPARASVRVAFAAAYGPSCSGGTIVVRAAEHVVEAPFVPVRARDVRVRPVDAVRVVPPGETFTVAARVENAGDLTERLAFGIAGVPFAEHVFASRMVAAGCAADVALQIAVPADVPDGTSFAAAFVATGDDGESARAPFAVGVRQAVASDPRKIVLGETSASDASLGDASRGDAPLGDAPLGDAPLGDASRGDARLGDASLGDASRGDARLGDASLGDASCGDARLGDARLGDTQLGAWVDDTMAEARPMLRADVSVPDVAIAGAPFGVWLVVDVDQPVDTLTVRSAAPDGAAYVPGTAMLDGRVLLDGTPFGVCPFDGRGLVVRGIPAGTRLTFAWSLRADDSPVEPIVVVARLDADGESSVATSPEIVVRARDAFAARPPGTPYHVESCATAPATCPPFLLGRFPDGAPWFDASNIEPEIDASKIERTIDAPEIEQAIDAPEIERVIDTPEIERMFDAPEIERMFDAPAVERMSEAPELERLVATSRTELDLRGINAYESARPFAPDVDVLAAAIASLDADRFGPSDAIANGEPPPEEPSLRLTGERRSEIERLFVRARSEGLVAHLFVLRFFFPDALGADAAVAAALDGVRDALRDVFDRLFVKLRIPGFDVSSDDLEDADLRTALIALFRQLAPARSDAANILTMLADASYGSPAVLRALVSLLPARCDDDPPLGAALARYASAIGEALARYDGLPLEIFDDALARRGDRALDDARTALIEALRTHAARVAVA